MKKKIQVLFTVGLILSLSTTLFAQDKPIGYWESHLSYNTAIGIASGSSSVYCATEISFFSYNTVTGEQSTHSKVDGMSDSRLTCIGHDELTETTVIGYQNSNIDLFSNNSFYNIPYLKIKTVSGAKTIYHIACADGYAYLSTGIGVLVINLKKKEVKELYSFSRGGQSIETRAFAILGNFFYAATVKGLYRANRDNPNLQAQTSWTLLDSSRRLNYIASTSNKLYVSSIDTMFVLNNDTLKSVYAEPGSINHIDAGLDGVFICKVSEIRGRAVLQMDLNNNIVDSVYIGLAQQTTQMADGTWYIADQFGGVAKTNGKNVKTYIVPSGPRGYSNFAVYAENKAFITAHGGFTDLYQQTDNGDGFSRFINGGWQNFSGYTVGDFPNDVVSLAKNPVDNSIWAGTMHQGLAILYSDKANTVEELYKHSPLEISNNDTNLVPANSIAADGLGNMWVTQNLAPDELAARTKAGTWYHFNLSGFDPRGLAHSAAGIILDDANQKWFYSPYSPSVVAVYNDNYTIENPADDSYKFFTAADDIPGSRVFCLAKDKNGAIWIGTNDGIARMNCPEQAIAGTCKPEVPTVQYDQFAGKLFQGEQVNTIAVDGANRKWIGTNNGVWLVSPDADKIVFRFTEDNSPLPSNTVRSIAVDPVTGDVYIGTDNGLITYRSTATEGGEQNSDVITFPNPVPSGYKGTIAIRGLVENADVRITDIAGQLIYRTTALGGQAVWSGVDYTGHRPQSGVLLIFVTNKDGSQTYTGKMIFMN